MNTDLLDYDVLWDGAHHDRDDDLLVEDARIPEKLRKTIPTSKGTSAQPFARDIVWRALPSSHRKAITVDEIIALTGCTQSGVQNALYQLRARELVHSKSAESCTKGGRLKRYWATR